MKIKLFLLIAVAFLAFPQIIQAKSIGWISDIHAGGTKYRNSGSETGNIQEPKTFDESLISVLKELKKKSVDLVISTGDMVNTDEENYGKKILKISRQYEMRMLWVKGNHDRSSYMRDIFGFSSGKFYYYYDYENIRIVVLNNTVIYDDFYGGLSQEQIDWLKTVLETDKEVIIAMHIPIFSESTGGYVLLERYEEFENIVSSSGNVKLVLAGHYHENYEKEINGVKYKLLQPMTKKGENRSYAMINLADYSIEFARAKKVSYMTKDEKEKAKPRAIRNSKSKVRINSILIQSGKNFSKNSSVQIFSNKLGGIYNFSNLVKTDKKGSFAFSNKINKPVGKYCWYALDTKNNKKSKKACFTVK